MQDNLLELISEFSAIFRNKMFLQTFRLAFSRTKAPTAAVACHGREREKF